MRKCRAASNRSAVRDTPDESTIQLRRPLDEPAQSHIVPIVIYPSQNKDVPSDRGARQAADLIIAHFDRLLPEPPHETRVGLICRRQVSTFALVHISADAFSALQPGDILQVGGPAFQARDLLSSINH